MHTHDIVVLVLLAWVSFTAVIWGNPNQRRLRDAALAAALTVFIAGSVLGAGIFVATHL